MHVACAKACLSTRTAENKNELINLHTYGAQYQINAKKHMDVFLKLFKKIDTSDLKMIVSS